MFLKILSRLSFPKVLSTIFKLESVDALSTKITSKFGYFVVKTEKRHCSRYSAPLKFKIITDTRGETFFWINNLSSFVQFCSLWHLSFLRFFFRLLIHLSLSYLKSKCRIEILNSTFQAISILVNFYWKKIVGHDFGKFQEIKIEKTYDNSRNFGNAAFARQINLLISNN